MPQTLPDFRRCITCSRFGEAERPLLITGCNCIGVYQCVDCRADEVETATAKNGGNEIPWMWTSCGHCRAPYSGYFAIDLAVKCIERKDTMITATPYSGIPFFIQLASVMVHNENEFGSLRAYSDQCLQVLFKGHRWFEPTTRRRQIAHYLVAEKVHAPFNDIPELLTLETFVMAMCAYSKLGLEVLDSLPLSDPRVVMAERQACSASTVYYEYALKTQTNVRAGYDQNYADQVARIIAARVPMDDSDDEADSLADTQRKIQGLAKTWFLHIRNLIAHLGPPNGRLFMNKGGNLCYPEYAHWLVVIGKATDTWKQAGDDTTQFYDAVEVMKLAVTQLEGHIVANHQGVLPQENVAQTAQLEIELSQVQQNISTLLIHDGSMVEGMQYHRTGVSGRNRNEFDISTTLSETEKLKASVPQNTDLLLRQLNIFFQKLAHLAIPDVQSRNNLNHLQHTCNRNNWETVTKSAADLVGNLQLLNSVPDEAPYSVGHRAKRNRFGGASVTDIAV